MNCYVKKRAFAQAIVCALDENVNGDIHYELRHYGTCPNEDDICRLERIGERYFKR